MTADEFAKIIREGSDKLRVDDVVISTPDRKMHGKGMLKITKRRLEVEVALDAEDQVPEMKSGIYTRRDAWKITGTIEDHLRFKCDHVGPAGNSKWFNGRTRLTLRLNPIDLVPSGFESLTREERAVFWKSAAEAQGNVPAALVESDSDLQPDTASFHAILVEFPFIAFNVASRASEGTVFFEEFKSSQDWAYFGDIGNFDLGLVKTNGDLHVHLRSKAGQCPATREEDWRKFYSVMDALALIHAVNAWPYRVQYWRNGQKIADRLTDADSLAKSNHAPFTERLAFNARTGSVKWDLGEAT
jgi:hypothetical protein